MILLDQPEYGFLKTDPHLGKNIIFLTCGGSYSYGTNVEGSDIDIRGYTLNSKADLLDMGNFEQMIDDHADTTWKRGWTTLSKTHHYRKHLIWPESRRSRRRSTRGLVQNEI